MPPIADGPHRERTPEPGYSVAEAAARLGISVARIRQLIATGRLASSKVGARRYVRPEAVDELLAARRAREDELRAAAPTEWDWEGNLVETLSGALRRQGWSEVSRADAAIRQHGIDLEMEKGGRSRVFEVKGWPTSQHQTGPRAGQAKRWRPTMGRSYVGDLVLSMLLLRSSRPEAEVAIAVPQHETFTRLLERIRPSLETLGVGAYVIDQDGDVMPLVAIEDVDAGRLERDRAAERAQVRRLLDMSDAEREAHFVSSNRAALEMLADARRAG